MKTIALCCCGALSVAICLTASPATAVAALTPEHRRELSAIRRDLSKVAATISREKFDDAEKMLEEIEGRIDRLAAAAGLPAGSTILVGLRKTLALRRHALAVKQDPEKAIQDRRAGVSFVKYVAPILNSKCVSCHGDDSLGGLKLNSFAAMKKGGKSGLVLAAGNASRSLLMLRLTTPVAKLRMPKNGEPLSRAELAVLALWINQGARFDGDDAETELAELLKPKKELPSLKGYEPTGKETLSFKKDIAPWMITYCVRCHSGKDPKGGLSLESFDGLMRGGNRGPAIVPGKPEESLAYELMGSFDETKRMPADQKKLLRRNWDDLGRWIFEGAKYDGGDPKLLLRALNPTASQVQSKWLASLTPEEFIRFRAARTAEQWKAAFPDTKPESISADAVLYYGNVSADRLGKIQEWTEEHVRALRTLFELEAEQPAWKGKLAVFVLANRADFEKFNEVVTKRTVFEDTFAETNISPTFEDAYLVLYDTGDTSAANSPALRFSLIAELTNAYLVTSEADYPGWLGLGLGPALAARKASKKDEYVQALRESAVPSLEQLQQPTDVFKEGVFFSSEQARPVGFTLVEFMLTKGGGENRFSQFIQAQQQTSAINALRIVYRSEPEAIARNYLSTFKLSRKQKK